MSEMNINQAILEAGEAMAAAEAALEKLVDEETNLPSQLTLATRAGNAERIIALTSRRKELPTYIFAARVTVVKARIAYLHTQRREAHANHNAARANLSQQIKAIDTEIETTKKHLEQLFLKRNNVQTAERGAYAVVSEFNAKIQQAEDELQALVHQQVPPPARTRDSDVDMYERSKLPDVIAVVPRTPLKLE